MIKCCNDWLVQALTSKEQQNLKINGECTLRVLNDFKRSNFFVEYNN